MKKEFIMAVCAVGLAGCSPKGDNVLLQENWGTLYGVPPFAQIELEDYKPAIERLVRLGREAIDSIAEQSEPATFGNTVVALQFADRRLEQVLSVFSNLNSAQTSEPMQALALELSPLLTAYSNDMTLNERLFGRIRAVYEEYKKGELTLTREQEMLLEKTYRQFVRSGANLSPEQKLEYRRLSEALARLSLEFEQNLLAATNAFQLYLTDEADLAGLPQSVRDGAAAEAREAEQEEFHTGGWLFRLDAPSYIPFMTYADRRDLRERLYRAYNSRALGGEFDNQQVLRQIVNLRLELAQLMGYATYADYVLTNRMAQTTGRVTGLLDELLTKSKPYARQEVEMIGAYAAEQGLAGPLQAWDWAYYTEKYKAAHFDLSDEMTRPYFRLERVEGALFLLAERLYGLSFRENASIPAYHPDVHAFEVYDSPQNGGGMLGVLYIDYFPRAGKRSGAWMTSYRDACVDPVSGEAVLPVISLVCNFTKPTAERPSLLSFDEVSTLFHEFGHGLHGILGRGSYPTLTGTSVYRDFVELPSQLLENWVSEREFLDLWAEHYQTGDKMPPTLIQKIVDTKRFLSAYSNVRQVQFGVGDMAWHTIREPLSEAADVADFERAATARTQLLPPVDGTCFAPGFSHIFAGGYAAGYYSYKWAEVLEADAYDKFQRAGIFDLGVADRFRRNILEPGGSEYPMTLYVRFAGAEPTVEPLLKKMGIDR